MVIDTRHLVERDAVEEDLHVLDGVDGDAGLADVADDPRVVAVVAAVRGEVEGHRQAHLPGGEVGPVEGVRLLGGGEAGVLADRPRPVGVHRGPHAPEERVEPGQRVDGLEPLEVGGGVERLHRDALGRGPRRATSGSPFSSLAASCFPVATVSDVRCHPCAKGYDPSFSGGEAGARERRQLAWESCCGGRRPPRSAWRAAATPGAADAGGCGRRGCQSPQLTGRRRAAAAAIGRSAVAGLGWSRWCWSPAFGRLRGGRGASTRRSCVLTSGVSPGGVTVIPVASVDSLRTGIPGSRRARCAS